jgi:hypothetical protein
VLKDKKGFTTENTEVHRGSGEVGGTFWRSDKTRRSKRDPSRGAPLEARGERDDGGAEEEKMGWAV